MGGGVLDDFIIEQFDLGVVLLDVAFDLPVHALQLLEVVLLEPLRKPALSAVHCLLTIINDYDGAVI